MSGTGEIVLLLVILFVLFGPKKAVSARTLSWQRRVLIAVVVVAPPLVVFDFVGTALAIPFAARLWLAAAAMACSALTLALASSVERHAARTPRAPTR